MKTVNCTPDPESQLNDLQAPQSSSAREAAASYGQKRRISAARAISTSETINIETIGA